MGNIVPVTPKQASVTPLGRMSTWKTAKIMAFQADFNAFSWLFSSSIKSLDGLMEEMKGFPNSRYDDYLDSISMLYDDRVQALLPVTHVKRDPWWSDSKRILSFPMTRWTGLTGEVEVERHWDDDYGNSKTILPYSH
jgi:hypothetical protein